MFKSVAEKVIVGVLTALVLAAVYALWDAIEELRLGVGVPRGAVLIFDDPSGCPEKWINMGEEWRGHVAVMAVGDANDTYAFGRTGGAEKHKLTEAEMPSHSHRFRGQPIATGGWGGTVTHPIGVGDQAIWKEYVPSGTIDPTGGDQAHNNMPPYIALYYCKKE